MPPIIHQIQHGLTKLSGAHRLADYFCLVTSGSCAEATWTPPCGRTELGPAYRDPQNSKTGPDLEDQVSNYEAPCLSCCAVSVTDDLLHRSHS